MKMTGNKETPLSPTRAVRGEGVRDREEATTPGGSEKKGYRATSKLGGERLHRQGAGLIRGGS